MEVLLFLYRGEYSCAAAVRKCQRREGVALRLADGFGEALSAVAEADLSMLGLLGLTLSMMILLLGNPGALESCNKMVAACSTSCLANALLLSQ